MVLEPTILFKGCQSKGWQMATVLHNWPRYRNSGVSLETDINGNPFASARSLYLHVR